MTTPRTATSSSTSWQRGICRRAAPNSAAQALEMLRAASARGEPFDLAILDLYMPDMDGLDLARAIKAVRHTRGTPHSAELLCCRLCPEQLSKRVPGHLIKPVRQSQLFDCIANCMGAAPMRRGAAPRQIRTRISADRGCSIAADAHSGGRGQCRQSGR